MRRICLLLALGLGSCAGTNYPYYVIHPEVDKLEAAKEKDDLPLMETCKPRIGDQAPCIGMLREEFFKQQKELINLRQSLKDCQKGPKP